MKTITLQTILTALNKDAKGSRGCAIAIAIFLTIMIAGGGIVLSSATGFVITAVAVLFFVFFLVSSFKTKKRAADKAFYIISVTCQEKYLVPSDEASDSYVLVFSNGLTHNLCHSDMCLITDDQNRNEEWLYNGTEIGDMYYLLYLEGEDKPVFVFPYRYCRLDTTGFVIENSKLRPRK